MTALFRMGRFTLHSGEAVAWKIECDALKIEDLVTLAWLLSQRVPSFGSVEGVATGGTRLARQLRPYVTTGPVLIVDDVLTTGASMEELRGDRDAIGAVLFARGRSDCPDWILPLFTMAR